MAKQKRILLVQPPTFLNRKTVARYYTDLIRMRPILPYNVLCLASFLRHEGAEAYVAPLGNFFVPDSEAVPYYDGTPESINRFVYRMKEVVDDLFKNIRPDVFGISVPSMDYYSARLLINMVRKCHPEVMILVGGYDPSFTAEEWLREDPCPDAVVMGEGENPMRELVARNFALDGTIPGVAYRQNGSIIHGGVSPLLSETEVSYPMDYGALLNPPSLGIHNLENGILFGRGCPYQCSFCVNAPMTDRTVRYKNIDILEDELRYFSNRGLTWIGVVDAIINLSRRHFQQFCNLIRKYDHMKVYVSSKINCIRKEDVALMRGTPIYRMSFGLESVSPPVLKAMDKFHYDAGKASRALDLLKDIGLEIELNVIVGHPGSKKEYDLTTFDFIETLLRRKRIDSFILCVFKPFPGTPASSHPSVRIVQPNKAEWIPMNPVCELVAADGKVTYSIEEMQDVIDRYIALGKEHRVF